MQQSRLRLAYRHRRRLRPQRCGNMLAQTKLHPSDSCTHGHACACVTGPRVRRRQLRRLQRGPAAARARSRCARDSRCCLRLAATACAPFYTAAVQPAGVLCASTTPALYTLRTAHALHKGFQQERARPRTTWLEGVWQGPSQVCTRPSHRHIKVAPDCCPRFRHLPTRSGPRSHPSPRGPLCPSAALHPGYPCNLPLLVGSERPLV